MIIKLLCLYITKFNSSIGKSFCPYDTKENLKIVKDGPLELLWGWGGNFRGALIFLGQRRNIFWCYLACVIFFFFS